MEQVHSNQPIAISIICHLLMILLAFLNYEFHSKQDTDSWEFVTCGAINVEEGLSKDRK